MFDSLKKKFASWLKPDTKKPKKAKAKAKKESKKAIKKEKKEVKKVVNEKKETKKIIKEEKKQDKQILSNKTQINKEKSISQITQERELSEKLLQDIKKEGLDTTSPEVKVDQAIKEIKEEEEEKQAKEEGKLEPEETPKEKKSWWPFGKKKEEKKEVEELKEEISDFKEESEEEIKVEEKPNFFSKLMNKLSTSKLNDEDFEDAFQDLEITLLENNTALEAVDKIKQSLKDSLVNKDIKKEKVKDTIISSLKESILSVLIEPPNLINQIKESKGIFTILFFGINGSGKTTSVAKLAYKLKQQGISCVLAAGDTFRAASIEQLRTHADKIGVPIIAHDYGSDPASVAFEAKKYAEKNNIKVVLIDTAGRMYTKTNLLKEMEKIIRVSKPDLKIFVGESITGNDATEQAKTFNESAGIDGIILSKADVDEKAGAILSVSQVTGKPIYYLGVGQGIEDIIEFKKKDILKNLGLE